MVFAAQDPPRRGQGFGCSALGRERSARGISEQSFDNRCPKCVRTLHESITEFDGPVRRRAVDERRRGIHRSGLVLGAPAPDGIEVFERVAEREEISVTVDAGVGRQTSSLRRDRKIGTHRLGPGKRSRRGHTQEVGKNPFTASGGRRVGGIDAMLMSRRDHQDAALSKQSGSLRRTKRDATELLTHHIRNAVVLRELLIEKSVIRIPDLDRIAVLAELAQQKQFRFAAEGLSQREVVVGKEALVGLAPLSLSS